MIFFLSFQTHCQDKLTCYIHGVTPVITTGDTKYFNYVLQTKHDLLRGVSFSPEKQPRLEAIMTLKSPVKIKNFRKSIRYSKESYITDNDTIKSELDEVGFPRCEQIDTSQVINISVLPKVALEQLVIVKAKVVKLSTIKQQQAQNGDTLRKQEAHLADPTGVIKCTFWEDFTNRVEQGKTYTFIKLRLKMMNNERYLNHAPKSQPCMIEESSPYPEHLPEVPGVSALTVVKTCGEIIGVTSVAKYNVCCKFHSKITMNGDLPYCKPCTVSIKSSKCQTNWFLRIFFEETGSSNSLALVVYNDVAEALGSLCAISNMSQITTQEFTKEILKLDTLKI